MQINGPIEIAYVVTALFAALSIVLLLGKGSWLIAGYNTASKEEKEKFDERKLCLVVGVGMGFIALLLFVTCFIWNKVPSYFPYVLLTLIILDALVTIILGNTICRKK